MIRMIKVEYLISVQGIQIVEEKLVDLLHLHSHLLELSLVLNILGS